MRKQNKGCGGEKGQGIHSFLANHSPFTLKGISPGWKGCHPHATIKTIELSLRSHWLILSIHVPRNNLLSPCLSFFPFFPFLFGNSSHSFVSSLLIVLSYLEFVFVLSLFLSPAAVLRVAITSLGRKKKQHLWFFNTTDSHAGMTIQGSPYPSC